MADQDERDAGGVDQRALEAEVADIRRQLRNPVALLTAALELLRELELDRVFPPSA